VWDHWISFQKKQIVMHNEKAANSDVITGHGEESMSNHHDHTGIARIGLFVRKPNSTSAERTPINSQNIFEI
jgi:hypothetical protein